MSVYFSLPAFARAKKNKDELQKSNPKNPVLKDEDEKFLQRQIFQTQSVKPIDDIRTTKISDDGGETSASKEEVRTVPDDQVVVPETQPESPDQTSVSAGEKRRSRHQDMDLPSQEEAEAVTRGWNEQVKLDDRANVATDEKKTWASYIPSYMIPSTKTSGTQQQQRPFDITMSPVQPSRQTWTEYASSYLPEYLKKVFSKDPDSRPEAVYNEDGSINETATKEKQEREISVLLDNLNMSSINNRVFALSNSTQDIYERFSQVLKDTINGAPTAYDDMDKLMREAGPQLEKQFKSMPPFIQTLVKSLPAKIGATLAPELLAAASDKPGHDMKVGGAAKGSSSKTAEGSKNKKKRRIPGLKSLISKEGAVATLLRNTVTFLQTRFPFLASMTNVVMSLAVFILMFVFWYCHKRGKEVRLAQEAEAENQKDGVDEDDEEADDTDEDDDDGPDLEKTLHQTDPKDVPLPTEDSKNAANK